MPTDATPLKLGLHDEDLSVHPTAYAPGLFTGQVAVVSGGAGGIGRAICWLFARLGAHVCVVGRNQAKLEQFTKKLADAGLKASAEVTDIKDADAVDRLF